jgi:fucose 4-O-acetylase-like acetyltransferase
MTPARLPFLDWLKCLGMALIVFGHVSTSTDHLTPPIYPKQLGVAFFLFAAGFALARERRPTGEVLFRRLFEVYLFGIGFALLMSVVQLARVGDPNESNYLPFVLGINVGFNNFPANPTTWYIGTYLHALMLWGLVLRRVQVRPWMLLATVLAEVAIRAALAQTVGLFVAYMALTNWATVFLMGIYCGQRSTEEAPPIGGAVRWLAGMVLLGISWNLLAGSQVSSRSFPFMSMAVGPRALSLAARSAAVSVVYIGFTWMAYQVTRRLPESATVRFLARNTLLIFIAHMPIYYVLQPLLARSIEGYANRVFVLTVVCFPMLAVASEGTRSLIRPDRLREWLWVLARRLVPPDLPRADRPATEIVVPPVAGVRG